LKWAYAITVLEELSRAIKGSEQARTLIDAAMVTLAYLPSLVDIDSSSGGTSPQLKTATSPSPAAGFEPAKKKFSEPVTEASNSSSVPSSVPSPSPVVRHENNDANSPRNIAMADPVVRKMLDVFDGRLVNISTPQK
jgi:hypothetical protein